MTIELTEIGHRIRKVRGQRSGKEFGDMLGVSFTVVSAYENGNSWPKPQTLDKIIKLSGKPADWLLYGKESTQQPDAAIECDTPPQQHQPDQQQQHLQLNAKSPSLMYCEELISQLSDDDRQDVIADMLRRIKKSKQTENLFDYVDHLSPDQKKELADIFRERIRLQEPETEDAQHQNAQRVAA